MKGIKKFTSAVILWTMVLGSSLYGVSAAEVEDFTATSAEEEAYWYSRYNLGNLVMRSGMWERMKPDMDMVMMALEKVDADFDKMEFMKGNDDYGDGDHPRPPKNPFLIQSVYKSGDPHYVTKLNPDDFATQKWDESKMDKTLTLEAFAYTIQKEVEWAKDFHWEEHFGKTTDDWGAQWRFVGMALTMEAKMQAKYIMENKEQLQKNKSVYGHFALLGAISDLTGMMNDDSFEANSTNRYQDKKAGKMFGNMADMMFEKWYEKWILPTTIKEYGTAIKSLVWYAKNTKKMSNKKMALEKIVEYSDALVSMEGSKASEEAYRLAGLIEAQRVVGVNAEITTMASQKFLDSFDTENMIFKNQNTYTIDEVGTIIGALNEIKLFIVEDTTQSEEVFRDFFNNVVNASGLIQSAPPLKIAKSPWEYEGEPENYFRAPWLKKPPMAGWEFGVAPVFATEVSFENGEWKVTDSNFDTAGAMHASNEMIWLHYDELNGFPKLHSLSDSDTKLLKGLEPKVQKLSDAKKQMIISKLQTLYPKYATNLRIIEILKALEKMLK